MEFAMMGEMVAAARARDAKTIRGFYYPTAKNGMVRDFYKTQGFAKVSEDVQGNAVWELDVSNGYEPRNHHIKIER
jgi:predicted enzyme involved in methoxymalonyl-ACP biosynthesis